MAPPVKLPVGAGRLARCAGLGGLISRDTGANDARLNKDASCERSLGEIAFPGFCAGAAFATFDAGWAGRKAGRGACSNEGPAGGA